MLPSPSFEHLLALSDEIGTFEHADHVEARRAHGYCTDDMARVLVVLCREPSLSGDLLGLADVAMRFLVDAQGITGTMRNRRDERGRWSGPRGVEDCWGRGLWAFGTAANRGQRPWLRQHGLAAFGHGMQQRSPWPRSMAFAALGAAEVLAADPSHYGARRLLLDGAIAVGGPGADRDWPWPEPRLTYANAVLPEVLLAAGHALGEDRLVEDGLTLLTWLLDRETVDRHLSPTPVGGGGPVDRPPGFDQQPIEVATMADACARAASITGDARWLDALGRTGRWFTGDNDVAAPMWDPATGGGFDGLTPTGPNLNQGAESTLALLAVLQHGRNLPVAIA